MCCTRLAKNTERKNSPSAQRRVMLSGYIFATKAWIDNRENLLNSNIFSTRLHHNMVNFGPLTTEIDWRVWFCGRTESRRILKLGFANFNGFRVLALLLHRRRSTEVNQTLHDAWPSPGLVHYIYTF